MMIKKFKFNIFITLILILFVSIIPSKASEIENINNFYQEMRAAVQDSFDNGEISQEDYNAQMEEFNKAEKEALEEIEQEKLEEKIDVISQSEQKPNIITNLDENGEKIKDYTNIDINTVDTKKTITFDVNTEEGTNITKDFYIKVTISAMNLIFEDSVILDESNNFTGSILVPNDVYIVNYFYPEASTNNISADDSYIDASVNPTRTIYVVGGDSIITDKQEIIEIEGEKIVEEKGIDIKTIIIISLIVLIPIITTLTIIVIKKKRENDI